MKQKIRKIVNGFTLIELLVAMAVMATLAVIVLASFRQGEKSRGVNLAADTVTQAIRVAQNDSKTGLQVPSFNCTDKLPSQYDLVFNPGSTVITLFATDKCSNAPVALETYTMPNNFSLSSTGFSVDSRNVSSSLDIKFIPPFATSTASVDGGAFAAFNASNFKVQSTDGSVVQQVALDGISGRVDKQVSQTAVVTYLPLDCSNPTYSVDRAIWPVDHGTRNVTIGGVVDPNGDTPTIVVTSIFQDDKTNFEKILSYSIDGGGIGSSTAWIRSEYSGTRSNPANGRVYHIFFTASDTHSQSCNGTVLVPVPTTAGGTATDDGSLYDSTIAAPAPPTFSQISTGTIHTCALADNYVYCWGNNSGGPIGDGTITNRTTPVQVLKGNAVAADTDGTYLTNIKEITAGYRTTCVISKSNHIYCWGYNGSGQLGNGNTSDSYTPVQVLKGAAAGSDTDGTYLTNMAHISTGFLRNTCAVANSGNVYCWGWNANSGALGNGNNTDSSVPVQVLKGAATGSDTDGTYLTNAASVSAGAQHACALSKSNNVYCWGYNGQGQIGNGTVTNSNLPVQVLKGAATGTDTDGTYLTNVAQISAGHFSTGVAQGSTCARTLSSNMYCWGYDAAGQLGDGTTTNSSQPVRVLKGAATGTDTDGTYLINQSSGLPRTGNNNCAIQASSKVYCWGFNNSGQLGINSTTTSLTPAQVLKGAAASTDTDGTYLINLSQISVGVQFSCALSASNHIYCWGSASGGLLGNGASSGVALVPVEVTSFPY
jgi:prepilin-type N-terminal cleavage/methylation domain-containing protein